MLTSLLLALVYIAVFSAVAWGVVALVPAPNPTVAMVKNVIVGVLGLLFLVWLVQHFGILDGHTVRSVR